MPKGYDRREAALYLALTLAISAIAGAWFSELALGFVPCKLCLWQRWPYYIGIPLLLAAVGVRAGAESIAGMRAMAGLALLAFAVSLGLGVYHAGVEWALWAGPADCGGRISAGPGSVEEFRRSLERARVVLCTEAPGRLLGLSFAGWNAVVSALITGFCLRATRGTA